MHAFHEIVTWCRGYEVEGKETLSPLQPLAVPPWSVCSGLCDPEPLGLFLLAPRAFAHVLPLAAWNACFLLSPYSLLPSPTSSLANAPVSFASPSQPLLGHLWGGPDPWIPLPRHACIPLPMSPKTAGVDLSCAPRVRCAWHPVALSSVCWMNEWLPWDGLC